MEFLNIAGQIIAGICMMISLIAAFITAYIFDVFCMYKFKETYQLVSIVGFVLGILIYIASLVLTGIYINEHGLIAGLIQLAFFVVDIWICDVLDKAIVNGYHKIKV